MIRYRYNRQVEPPAPFLHVAIRTPDGSSSIEVPAQVDTAADQTVIPHRIVQALGLTPFFYTRVGGLNSSVFTVPTYMISVAVRGFSPSDVEVVAFENEPHVLLGRDVLNKFTLLLIGPELALEIS